MRLDTALRDYEESVVHGVRGYEEELLLDASQQRQTLLSNELEMLCAPIATPALNRTTSSNSAEDGEGK